MPLLNTLEIATRTICVNETSAPAVETVLAPCLLDDGQCLLQENPLMYSCAACEASTERLCACREYIDNQVALCAQCF